MHADDGIFNACKLVRKRYGDGAALFYVPGKTEQGVDLVFLPVQFAKFDVMQIGRCHDDVFRARFRKIFGVNFRFVFQKFVQPQREFAAHALYAGYVFVVRRAETVNHYVHRRPPSFVFSHVSVRISRPSVRRRSTDFSG